MTRAVRTQPGIVGSPLVAGLVAAAVLGVIGGGAMLLTPARSHASGSTEHRSPTASSPGESEVARAASAATTTATATVPSPSPAPPEPPAPRTDAAGTVWLCRPGLADDPCTQSLEATSVPATGAGTAVSAQPAAGSRFDCFYVYPTVSTQAAPNADLSVEPAEVAVAVRQASRFSQVCRVWAPIYRQRTLALLPSGSFDPVAASGVAYGSLLATWRDYLAHFNGGRPVVFIGHSQGTTMLINLIAGEVDPNPALRRQVVSALLIGGYAEVAPGADAGGSFQHIPACRSARQTGCVIAYNSYLSEPGPDSVFGRPGAQTLCTNPASLGGGAGTLDPYFVAKGTVVAGAPIGTPWVEYPGLYTASCQSAGGATWLQVTPVATPGDPRPRLTERLGPSWGLHPDDVSLALGNLVQDVAAQEASFP
jgi:hypothetical protein